MGRPESRLASATNLPMKPVAPMTRTRLLLAAEAREGDTVMAAAPRVIRENLKSSIPKCGGLNKRRGRYTYALQIILYIEREKNKHKK